MRPSRRHLLATLVAGGLAGCAGPSAPVTDGATPGSPGTVTPPMHDHRFTHHRPTGNRVVAGRGDLPDADPIDVRIETEPAWLIGAGLPDGTWWVVAGESGDLHGFRVSDGTATDMAVEPAALPAGQPPVVRVADEGPSIIAPPPSISPPSTPLPLGDGTTLFVDRDGGIGRWDGEAVIGRVAVEALPDARIVRAGPGRAVALTGATDRYDHGVLGDDIEADRVTLLEADDGLSVGWHARPAGRVIEGQAPIVADLGSGETAIVVTASDARDGASVLAFDGSGGMLASGPAIGTGFRWRHQLAVAPFAADGVPELAVVRTPHIGGRLEFYRRSGESLAIAATLDGYASHAIGSRNLDAAVAGDFDGDGRPEIVLPRNDRGTIAGVARREDGATESWTAAVGGTVATNLAGATRPDGSLVLGVGRADGTVRLWG